MRNLAWFLLAFVLTVWAGVASAQDTYWVASFSTGPGRLAGTGTAACEAAYAAYSGNGGTEQYGGSRAGSSSTRWDCLGRRTSGSIYVVSTALFRTCPVDRPYVDLSKNDCVSVKPAQPDPDPEPEPPPQTCPYINGTKFTFHLTDGTGPKGAAFPTNPSPFPRSSDECYLTGPPEVKNCYAYPLDDKTDQFACTYEGISNGQVVDKTQAPGRALSPEQADEKRKDVPPKEGNENGCPKGTVSGGISHSGVPICIGTGTDPKNKPPAPPKVETEKTETSDDGTKTTTKTETVTNSDGSKTTTTTVTVVKPDGTKQVDQQKDTSKTPSNAPGKDDSAKDDEKYDLCKQNPHLTICQNSSVAGKCGEISCSGDAIQCATLRAAAAMQCQQQKDLEDLSKAPGLGLGNAIAQGSDPMQGAIDNALKGTEIDLSKPSLDSSGFVGAGACLAPITMTVVGRPVTASFDSVCQNIQPLRYAIMACAYILVYLLVSRSILQG